MVFKHSSVVIRTDLAILLPDGCYGRIAPRSGLAVTHSISIGGGVIDRDYTGDIRVILFNHSDEDVHIKRGTRVAQLICEAALQPDLYELTELRNTMRGNKGFGSSGFM
ncbi:deoxyuridine 5'-triphosphate nucleotidohydrolase-like [Macrosteles quadrilineatus]|uniref:deoxyuridine 5'-triphosphate nucleotidohydrolase-like n=1 Tax=Macrosteles quadrilineatus TaxID=74068 RepID=UPI0023E2BA20|nr:deoxyuridine 5'-triphosphate nucleotidohydrolase-like [Macrosteles quadrilineatus]